MATKKTKAQYAICFDSKTGAIHTNECNHYRRYVAAGSSWSAWRSPFAAITEAEVEVKKEKKTAYYCKGCKPNEKPEKAAQAAQVKPKPKAQPKPKAKAAKA